MTYEVIFKHVSEIEADSETDAISQMVDAVQGNACAEDCEAWPVEEE